MQQSSDNKAIPKGKGKIDNDKRVALELHAKLNDNDSIDESVSEEEEEEVRQESDIEKTLRIISEHERTHKRNEEARAVVSAQSVLVETHRRTTDPQLLFFILGDACIRKILLFYIEIKDLIALSETCPALHYIVTRCYIPTISKRQTWDCESFAFFATGCWQSKSNDIAFADRTSVAYYMMNQNSLMKYALFNGQHFVAVPKWYLEDLVKICWTVYSIVSRCQNECINWSYHAIMIAVSDAQQARDHLKKGVVQYIVGDRYTFSHELTTPFIFDWRIPSRGVTLRYFRKRKAEIALAVLCGETINQLDETTNNRLKLYDARTKLLRNQIRNDPTLLHSESIAGGITGAKNHFNEWKFIISRPPHYSVTLEEPTVEQEQPEAAPSSVIQQTVEKVDGNSCVIV